MTQVEFFSKNVFFTTRRYSFALGLAMETASRQLKKLAASNALILVTRGVWAQTHHPYFSRYGAVPYLLGNEQGCVSFLSALHRHGAISQIPKTIQIATTGRGRVLETPIGNFEFFQLQPKMFREGVEVSEGKLFYNLASVEKALIDTLYISTRKGHRFSRFPEIEKEVFKLNEIKKVLREMPVQVRKLVMPKIEELFSPVKVK